MDAFVLSRPREDRDRAVWQRRVSKAMKEDERPVVLLRMRRQLDRLPLSLLPGRRVDRALRLLGGLAGPEGLVRNFPRAAWRILQPTPGSVPILPGRGGRIPPLRVLQGNW